jgi:hypothetical protein
VQIRHEQSRCRAASVQSVWRGNFSLTAQLRLLQPHYHGTEIAAVADAAVITDSMLEESPGCQPARAFFQFCATLVSAGRVIRDRFGFHLLSIIETDSRKFVQTVFSYEHPFARELHSQDGLLNVRRSAGLIADH